VTDAWLARHPADFGHDVVAGRAIRLIYEKDPVDAWRARPSPRHSLSPLRCVREAPSRAQAPG